ncbi:MAG: aromatic amino acid transport family protein [Candidatus Jorgensenbacteria bacterium]|nr:aromatic amino acid transport family protein [Candidatus Jorgensenbacteria bacterium]
MNTYFIRSTSLLAGTIIGAGIFSLPFIFRVVGFATGTVYLALFTIVYIAVHAMYARVLEANKGEHQFFYLAKKYLPWGIRSIASCSIFIELFFVLATYLVLAPVFWNIVAPANFTFALVAFWFLGSVFIFMRLKWLGWAEALGVLSIAGIVVFIFILSLHRPFEAPLFETFDLTAFFLPFGPLLFALSGRPALSAVLEEHRKAKAAGRGFSLFSSVFWGTAISAVVYFLFIMGVLRLNPFAGPEALNSLNMLPRATQSLLGILGFVTLWTSYFVIGINVRDILHIDLRRSRILSALVVLIIPLVLYAIGFREFLPMVSFIGSVFLALEGIFIVWIWRSAFPKNPWRGWSSLLYVIFLIALGYEVVSFLGIL